MRTSWRNLLSPAVVVGLALAGCTTTSTKTTTTRTTTTPSPTTATPTTIRSRLGQSIDLHAQDGSVIALTAIRVIDPATADSGYPASNSGTRYVGVEIKALNRGPGTWSDDPQSSAQLVDDAGNLNSFEFATLVGCTALGKVTLAPGQSAQGCMTFSVLDGLKLVEFNVDATNGASLEKGTWALS